MRFLLDSAGQHRVGRGPTLAPGACPCWLGSVACGARIGTGFCFLVYGLLSLLVQPQGVAGADAVAGQRRSRANGASAAW